MAEFRRHNEQVIRDAFGVYLRDRIKPQVTRLVNDTASATIDYIDRMFQPLEKRGGNDQFPIWDGDLRDSTGVGVYIEGKLTRYKLSPFAQYGTRWLDEAFDMAANEFPTGAYVALFSAMPYAHEVDTMGSPADRGVGYFEDIMEFLSYLLKSNLNNYVNG